MRKQRIIRGFLLASLLLAYVGCQLQVNQASSSGKLSFRFLIQGGAGSGARSILAVGTRAKLILPSAQSLSVTISEQGAVKAQKTVAITPGQSIVDVSFDSVPLIPFQVSAQAYDGPNGTGNTIFQATADQNVSQG